MPPGVLESTRDETLAVLAELVAFPTVTSRSNRELIAYARDYVERFGADTFEVTDDDGRRANLFATFGPSAVDGGVVLSGHTDVVPPEPAGWSSPPFTATRRDDRIYGRGTVDMKGFLACVLATSTHFAEAELTRPVHVALTFDEEIGCQGAPLLLDEVADRGVRPGVAIVGEPTSMDIVYAHKGCYEYTTTIRGVERHGSTPDQGVSALEYGVRYVGKLLELKERLRALDGDPEFSPPESTLNVGVIDAGSARNVVAGNCEIQWEMRPVTPDHAAIVLGAMATFERELDAELRGRHPDAGLVRTTAGAVGGLAPSEASPAVSLLSSILPTATHTVAAYNTEAGLYQSSGIPAAVCGPGDIDLAHRPDENLPLEQLDRCLEMLHALILELSADEPLPEAD
ncbi:MAG: acetylornithine deacetylase [Nitriliruptorales bacterium]|nr:acetylornithine deacetylase [Nitriliruptorales bacterium]